MLTVDVTWVLDLFSTFLPPSNPITGTLAGATAATYITIVGLTYASVFEKLTIKDLTGSDKANVEEFIRKKLPGFIQKKFTSLSHLGIDENLVKNFILKNILAFFSRRHLG